jgi:hypothetical protein
MNERVVLHDIFIPSTKQLSTSSRPRFIIRQRLLLHHDQYLSTTTKSLDATLPCLYQNISTLWNPVLSLTLSNYKHLPQQTVNSSKQTNNKKLSSQGPELK